MFRARFGGRRGISRSARTSVARGRRTALAARRFRARPVRASWHGSRSRRTARSCLGSSLAGAIPGALPFGAGRSRGELDGSAGAVKFRRGGAG